MYILYCDFVNKEIRDKYSYLDDDKERFKWYSQLAKVDGVPSTFFLSSNERYIEREAMEKLTNRNKFKERNGADILPGYVIDRHLLDNVGLLYIRYSNDNDYQEGIDLLKSLGKIDELVIEVVKNTKTDFKRLPDNILSSERLEIIAYRNEKKKKAKKYYAIDLNLFINLKVLKLSKLNLNLTGIKNIDKVEYLTISKSRIDPAQVESITSITKNLKFLCIKTGDLDGIDISKLPKLIKLKIAATYCYIKKVEDNKIDKVDILSSEIHKVEKLLSTESNIKEIKLYNSAPKFFKITKINKNIKVFKLKNFSPLTIPSRLYNLQSLSIKNCEFTHVQEKIKLRDIVKLTFSKCRNVRVDLKNLEHLEEFTIDACHFKELPKEIGELKKLKVLDIRNNEIEDISKINFSLLKKLYLSSNAITFLPKNITDMGSEIFYIDYSNNQISHIDESFFSVEPGENPEFLFSHNKLKELPKSISNIEFVFIDIENNKIKDIEIINTNKLKLLFINNNRIKSISNDFLDRLGTLMYEIDYSYNKLEKIPECIFYEKNLESYHGIKLYFAYNEIEKLPDNFSVKNIREIKLNNNHIKHLPNIDYRGLEELNLEYNDLLDLPPGIIYVSNIYILANENLEITEEQRLWLIEIGYLEEEELEETELRIKTFGDDQQNVHDREVIDSVKTCILNITSKRNKILDCLQWLLEISDISAVLKMRINIFLNELCENLITKLKEVDNDYVKIILEEYDQSKRKTIFDTMNYITNISDIDSIIKAFFGDIFPSITTNYLELCQEYINPMSKFSEILDKLDDKENEMIKRNMMMREKHSIFGYTLSELYNIISTRMIILNHIGLWKILQDKGVRKEYLMTGDIRSVELSMLRYFRSTLVKFSGVCFTGKFNRHVEDLGIFYTDINVVMGKLDECRYAAAAIERKNRDLKLTDSEFADLIRKELSGRYKQEHIEDAISAYVI